jgi:hypothetical protein
MQKLGVGGVLRLALKRQQYLEIRRRIDGKVVSGDQEASLDLTIDGLTGERRMAIS